MKGTPQYGSKDSTKILDEEGSTVTKTTNYKNYEVVSPERNRYKYRHRVTSSDDEDRVIKEFNKLREENPRILDPAIEYSHTADGNKNGYYYVITCYTILEY